MRFSEKIVKDAFEKSALKLAVLVLSITTLAFSFMLAMDLSKEALVIERGCESQMAKLGSQSQSKEEIHSFLVKAVEARFNTLPPADPNAFLVQDLLISRSKEQDELKGRGIDQRLIVLETKLSGDRFMIEADRLVAVGVARSAIPIKLSARLSSKTRSLTNPYGLILTSIDQIESKEEKRE